jgi:hypothetical protein
VIPRDASVSQLYFEVVRQSFEETAIMIRFSFSGRKATEPVLMVLRLLMFLLGFTVAVPVNAQSGPERDAAAITVLQNSVAAMGGVSGWGNIQDWTITGQVSTSGSNQQANFSWIGEGAEFRFEIDSGQNANLFLSGHGSPARISNGSVSPINYHVARANPPFYLPAVRLLQELNNQQLTIQYVGSATVHGQAAIQIHICDNSDTIGSLVTPHDWYFGASSFLPLEVQLRLPTNENAADYINGAYDFWQFQTINGLLVPSQLTLSKDNLPTKAFVVGSTTFNLGVPQSEFDPPQGGGQ